MAYDISKEVKDKVAEILAERERLATRTTNLQNFNDSIVAELTDAKNELKIAVEALAYNPTTENRQAENEARKKVNSLEFEVSGNTERRSAVFTTAASNIRKLQIETLQLAGTELKKNYNDNFSSIIQGIEEAKKTYLLSVKKLHELTMEDTQEKFFEIAKTINAVDFCKPYEPSVSMHNPLISNRDSSNYLGIFGDEIYNVFHKGEISERSIRK